MIRTYTREKLTWVDLEKPTREEIRDIISMYGIDPVTGEELLLPSIQPRVEIFRDYLYVVLYFPASRHTNDNNPLQEIDFVIGKNYLLTVRYDTVDAVHKFGKEFEVDSILEKSSLGSHAGFIFHSLVKKLYKSVQHELDFLSSALGEIEKNIFSGNEKEMVFELSKLSRELLHFKRSLAPHKEMLESFMLASPTFFGETFKAKAEDLLFAYERVLLGVSLRVELLNELRTTNDSILTTKQNQTLRLFSAISFITFPLALIVAILGLRAEGTPLVDHPNGFIIIGGGVAGIALLMFAYFEKKHWL